MCNQTSPVFFDNHTIVRSDQVSGENKGGVMISMLQTMLTSDLTDFSFSGPGILFEAISITILLPNGEHLQVTVVYRPPSMSTDNLECHVCFVEPRHTFWVTVHCAR